MTQAVAYGLVRRAVFKQADAAHGAWGHNRHGFQTEACHQFRGVGHGPVGLDDLWRFGHQRGCGYLRVDVGVEQSDQLVAHLAQGLVLHCGRGCIPMTAAAKKGADEAHIDVACARTGHDVDAIRHAAQGKHHLHIFHVNELVDEIRKIGNDSEVHAVLAEPRRSAKVLWRG